MRSKFPSFRRPDRLAVALLFVAAACDAGIGAGAEMVAGDAFAAPDRVIAGPQGAVGQFAVECGFDRFLADDPIVHPGAAGASHLHQFFGAIGVSVDSTHAGLVEGTTTCTQRADTASYWAPVLIDGEGTPIEPLGSTAYYRAGPDVDPTLVEPYPPGFMMVAGDHTAIEPQPLSVLGWSCGIGAKRSVTPPDCTDAPSLRMVVTYQDCWDGEHLRSPLVPDPDLHVAYSSAGECPESHPVHIPQLQFAIDYDPVDPDGLALSSGNILSGHADFWNAWDQGKLRNEVAVCINRNLTCGLAGP
jgi:hypothetical protein